MTAVSVIDCEDFKGDIWIYDERVQ